MRLTAISFVLIFCGCDPGLIDIGGGGDVAGGDPVGVRDDGAATGDTTGDVTGGDTAVGDAAAGDNLPGDNFVGADADVGCSTCELNNNGGSGGPIDSGVTNAFVLGQPSPTVADVNRGGAVGQNTLNNSYSFGAYVDPNAGEAVKFFINDRDNDRVLIFNSVPADTNALPDVVVGQPDFDSDGENAGQGATNDTGLADPVFVSVCPTGQMFVADAANHRIMVWNTIPTASGTAADFVIGQPDFVTSATGVGAMAFARPYTVTCIDDQLYVVDKNNDRILIYDAIPSDFGATPSVVIGQDDFVSNDQACSAARFINPYEVALAPNGILWVADAGGHRLLGYDGVPTLNGAAADHVVGQADFTSCDPNRGGQAANNTFNSVNGIGFGSGVMVVSDHSNQRLMVFDTPVTGGAVASAQIGQADFAGSASLQPPVLGSFSSPKGAVIDGGFVWVSDSRNNRVQVLPLP